MQNLFLRYLFTDRAGRGIYSIQRNEDGDERVLGTLRMKIGKDDGYTSGSSLCVDWNEEIEDPEKDA